MSEYLWVEKYRPKKISECILSEDTKKTFAELFLGNAFVFVLSKNTNSNYL